MECVLACKLLQVSIRPPWPHHSLDTAKKGPNRSTTGWPAHYITSPDTAPRSHTTGHPLVLHLQQERPRTKTETQRTRPQAQTPHTCTYYRPQLRYHPIPYSSQYTSPYSVPSSLTKRSPVPERHVRAVLTAVQARAGAIVAVGDRTEPVTVQRRQVLHRGSAHLRITCSTWHLPTR